MEEAQTPLDVSVVMVSYNCADALRKCLAALEQSAPRESIEIIVVDNGSRDESPTLDAEFPGVTFLRLPRNFGFSKALNIAMRTAKAELFLLLDPYVTVEPGTIAALAAKLKEEAEAVAVCPLLLTKEGEPAVQVANVPGPADVARCAWAGTFDWAPAGAGSEEKVAVPWLPIEAALVRGYFLKGLRYIDERYAQSWVDAELSMQIRRANRRILLYPGIRGVEQERPDLAAELPGSARALLAADWILGAATYAGKHFGFLAGLKIRVLAVLRALGAALFSVVRLRDVGYHFSRLMYVASGQKIDGTQTSL